MLSSFTDPYDDEILYSAIARYHQRWSYQNYKEIIKKMVKLSPEDRYNNIFEVRKALIKLFNRFTKENRTYIFSLDSSKIEYMRNLSLVPSRGSYSDIIEDNISTYRDRNGNKGILLQKAGMVEDSSEYSNLFYNEIKDYEKRIRELNERLIEKETILEDELDRLVFNFYAIA